MWAREAKIKFSSNRLLYEKLREGVEICDGGEMNGDEFTDGSQIEEWCNFPIKNADEHCGSGREKLATKWDCRDAVTEACK